MRRPAGFTLIELAIAMAIMLVVLALAIPSVKGVLADRKLQRWLDSMNDLVRQAEAHSLQERQPYLIVWRKDDIILRPLTLANENVKPVASLALLRGYRFSLRLPAALQKEPPPQWIFWPSGACEPATVDFDSPVGSWEVNYGPLTSQPEIVRYATK